MLSLRAVWLRGWTVRGPGSLPLDAVRLISGGGTVAWTYGHEPILGVDIICRISVSGIPSAGRCYAENQGCRIRHGYDTSRAMGLRHPVRHSRLCYFERRRQSPAVCSSYWDYLADNADAPQWVPGGTPSPVPSRERESAGLPATDLFTDRRTVTTTKDQDPVVARERASETNRRRMAEREEEVRRDHAARSAHVMAALASSRWDPPRLEATSLRWLQGGGHVDTSLKTPSEAAGALLHRMVRESAFAASVFDMLDAWRVWASAGSGMGRPHLEGLQAHKLEFAVASVLLGVVGEVVVSEVGVLAVDMTECMTRWKTVRSG
ncbi:hypothetical protein F5B18DRAFT_606445 [Nemania serpens]|nr:hypothetical protein F5B18DRAFT_606445 [Nemania serpens]